MLGKVDELTRSGNKADGSYTFESTAEESVNDILVQEKADISTPALTVPRIEKHRRRHSHSPKLSELVGERPQRRGCRRSVAP